MLINLGTLLGRAATPRDVAGWTGEQVSSDCAKSFTRSRKLDLSSKPLEASCTTGTDTMERPRSSLFGAALLAGQTLRMDMPRGTALKFDIVIMREGLIFDNYRQFFFLPGNVTISSC